ncbi:MAG TPA: hypothetical protein VMK05_05140 [Burkholderiales bacterium]|nr:hypothetical protein [Burkholderiales bacterium]
MFIVVRLVGILALVVVGACLLAYLVSRNRRYLRIAWQVFRLGVAVVLILLVLLVIERV